VLPKKKKIQKEPKIDQAWWPSSIIPAFHRLRPGVFLGVQGQHRLNSKTTLQKKPLANTHLSPYLVHNAASFYTTIRKDHCPLS
jgi:hypothetical protein